ncbi:MAG: polyribonucleotide nucleotidyltransferase [Candidatus Wallbacteria bacterium HGW-Wallbacteria-1]|jgi:polyribonucleotide nucleotidyltransferase|uniref:Polyribonucleotide nucleotidyltransferase n=1 Tax=Candidatus Wallbacteria bacterium HGW-Wallbacteria-1 TaxID=2013854 RepID=A0A2N1PQD4_9BACT|nr:MAG: polyribonucleotide nucleotidyltransferase [Candidatus Wallbacteria bacterium HGW-Wallbacteria-1]
MGHVEIVVGGRSLTIETGKLAKQAHGSALVRYGDTVVLVTTCGATEAREGADFLPLTVEYKEKTYAAGKIPGGFFKREGRPTTYETLSSRLIDRSIRPLFPDGYNMETQVVALVLSADKENAPEIPALIGTSAALCLSDIPYTTPIAGVKMGYIDGQFIVNPVSSQLDESLLELTVAGTSDAVCMVESGAMELSEDVMLEAIMLAHEEIKKIIAVQEKLIAECGKAKREFVARKIDAQLESDVESSCETRVSEILHSVREKKEREIALDEIRDQVIEKFYNPETDDALKLTDIKTIFHDLEKKLVRHMILDEGIRADGRKTTEIRQIDSEVQILPRTHGSALFTRGQTQSLGVVTLGSSKDEQSVENLVQDIKEKFFLHYNFPPFATGEARMMRSPGRREIGHGNLAFRALKPVIPDPQDFPYTIRVVSEILESNGSSSMATICSGSLAMMDAGVPLKADVSGIAMGLIAEDGKFAVLSDILGMEDHLGDMDFKVAGTVNGVTALQMDIKIKGLPIEIMKKALAQAKEGRLHILNCMRKALTTHKTELSEFAPRIHSMRIDPEKIGTVIGPGGKMIRSIIEATGVEIDIANDGTVNIFTLDAAMCRKAVGMIEGLTAEVEVGKIYEGKVVRVTNFGAFVEVLPGKDGLVHISELDHYRVNKVTDIINVGDQVMVKVTEIDDLGRVNLSRKAIIPRPEGTSDRPERSGEEGGRDDRNRDDRSRGPRDGRRRD